MRGSAVGVFISFRYAAKTSVNIKTRKEGASLVSRSPAVLSAQPHGRRGAGVVFAVFASVFGFWSVRILLFGLTRAPAQTRHAF